MPTTSLVNGALTQLANHPGSTAAAPAPEAAATGEFAALLRQAGDAVVSPQQAAQHAIQSFTRGADGELHKTMLSVERADIALKYFVSVRNRCLEAYREVMRMGG